MTQLAFAFNANECTGCKACVVACKDVNNLPVGYQLRRVVTAESGTWQRDPESGLPVAQGVFSYSVSLACLHCDTPACVASCPRGAIGKDVSTGIVSVDAALCIACGTCAKACPWQAPVLVPALDGSRAARTCDFCKELLDRGEDPACIAACPMRCLRYGSVAPDGFAEQGAGGAGVLPNAPWGEPLLAEASELGPNLSYTPHRRAAELLPEGPRIHSMPEEYAHE